MSCFRVKGGVRRSRGRAPGLDCHEEGPPLVRRSAVSTKRAPREGPLHVLHAGLDLSRKKLDVCLLSDGGEHLGQLAVAPDVDSLRRLARRIDELHAEPVSAVVESMTGARIVYDTLEAEGWSVAIADAQKVKGLGAACLQDGQDRLARAGDAVAARSGAGDLASRARDPRGARAPTAGAWTTHLSRTRRSRPKRRPPSRRFATSSPRVPP